MQKFHCLQYSSADLYLSVFQSLFMMSLYIKLIFLLLRLSSNKILATWHWDQILHLLACPMRWLEIFRKRLQGGPLFSIELSHTPMTVCLSGFYVSLFLIKIVKEWICWQLEYSILICLRVHHSCWMYVCVYVYTVTMYT